VDSAVLRAAARLAALAALNRGLMRSQDRQVSAPPLGMREAQRQGGMPVSWPSDIANPRPR
jgi:hypothetical protein